MRPALRVTYQVPAGTPRDEVIGHYRRILGADTLYSCDGFDCGRSNAWASLVYGQAVLYGPDRNQSYIAADFGGQLVSAYVIERGNRRIYAHVEVLQPVEAVSASANAKLTERLAGDGFSVIGGVRPRRDGTIPADGVRMLEEIAPQLRIFERQSLYVVCHLYGPESGEVLLERAGGVRPGGSCGTATRPVFGWRPAADPVRRRPAHVPTGRRRFAHRTGTAAPPATRVNGGERALPGSRCPDAANGQAWAETEPLAPDALSRSQWTPPELEQPWRRQQAAGYNAN